MTRDRAGMIPRSSLMLLLISHLLLCASTTVRKFSRALRLTELLRARFSFSVRRKTSRDSTSQMSVLLSLNSLRSSVCSALWNSSRLKRTGFLQRKASHSTSVRSSSQLILSSALSQVSITSSSSFSHLQALTMRAVSTL